MINEDKSLTVSTQSKMILLLSLYVAQGLPSGVFTQALPALLRSYGVSLSLISASALLALPWALKFMWAPMVDAYYVSAWGRRRSWILSMQLLGVLTLSTLIFFDPVLLKQTHGVLIFFFLMFLVNLFAATQDVATDALAVQMLHSHERGLANGIQVAGYRLGLIVGGGLLLYLLGIWGWQTTFIALVVLSIILLWPIFKLQEQQILHTDLEQMNHRREAKNFFSEKYWSVFKSFFERKGMMGWLIVLMTYKAGESLGSSMVKPMLVDYGVTLAQMGLMVSLVGSFASLSGALLGGLLTQSLGRYRAIIGFGILQAIGVLAYVILAWRHDNGMPLSLTWIYSINAFEHFVSGMAMAALLTALMDLSRYEFAASDFTLQVCLLMFFGGIFYMAAGPLAELVGYQWYFIISALLCFLLLFPAAYYCRHIPQLMKL
jgi:PAT family beta-lactamase induction signal transducer AmpG